MTPAEHLDDHQRKPRNVGKLLNVNLTTGEIATAALEHFF